MAKLSDRLRWEAERLPNKFSENDELFQLLTEAADELDKKPEQKTGKWVKFTGVNGLFICSHCETIVPVPAFNGSPVWEHCPRCGAKMEAEVEDERSD